MEATASKWRAFLASALLGVIVVLLGFSIVRSGQRVALQWSVMSPAYVGYGVAWIIGGAAMIVGGLWIVGSRGRHRIPLWVGALGSLLAGASVVIGVLTYVVPCSGPS